MPTLDEFSIQDLFFPSRCLPLSPMSVLMVWHLARFLALSLLLERKQGKGTAEPRCTRAPLYGQDVLTAAEIELMTRRVREDTEKRMLEERRSQQQRPEELTHVSAGGDGGGGAPHLSRRERRQQKAEAATKKRKPRTNPSRCGTSVHLRVPSLQMFSRALQIGGCPGHQVRSLDATSLLGSEKEGYCACLSKIGLQENADSDCLA